VPRKTSLKKRSSKRRRADRRSDQKRDKRLEERIPRRDKKTEGRLRGGGSFLKKGRLTTPLGEGRNGRTKETSAETGEQSGQ